MKRRSQAALRSLGQGLRTVGISRHAAMGAARTSVDPTLLTFGARGIALGVGGALIGIAVALLVHAGFGLTPYDVLSSAISTRLSLSLGQAGWLLAGVLFLIAGLLGQRPGPWGVAYILVNGVMIDAAHGIVTPPETLAGRSVFAAGAVLLMAAGITIVVESGISGGPFELLMRAGQARGVNPTTVRLLLDAGVFIAGVALGGDFGPATVLYGLTFGLCLQTVRQAHHDYRQGRSVRLNSSAGAQN